MKRRTALFKRFIVSIGSILLVAGVVFLVFPAQETYFETSTVKEEDMSRTLPPQNATFYGSLMNSSRSFQLDISSSNSSGAPAPVKVTVSISRQKGTRKDLIWGPFTESSFNQEVPASITGMYIVDIENENHFSVTLQGNILVKQTNENYRTVYAYVIPGFLIMLGGTGALIYGIFKIPSKVKRTRAKKIKR